MAFPMPQSTETVRLLLCRKDRGVMAVSCVGQGADDLLAPLQEGLRRRGLLDRVSLGRAACFSHCARGPNLRIVGGPFLHDLSLDTLEQALDRVEDALAARLAP
jgi:NADH:ubiquinone oxidoreductase subunit E